MIRCRCGRWTNFGFTCASCNVTKTFAFDDEEEEKVEEDEKEEETDQSEEESEE